MPEAEPLTAMAEQLVYQPAPTLAALNSAAREQMVTWRRATCCPACASERIGYFACLRHISYSQCRACGFTFADPFPSEQFLAGFYNSSFYGNYRKLEADHIVQDRYFSVSSYTDLRRLASWIEGDRKTAILDFGCGLGGFLALLRDEFGFKNVEGIELDRHGRVFARTHYDLAVVSNADELHNKLFDYVTLLEVIEHLPDPGLVLRSVTERVKPGGRLLISTPSVNNPSGRFFPSHCAHYTGPSHISLFTEKALGCLLSRLGFEIQRLEIDECTRAMGDFVTSPLYNLDVASPRASGDRGDLLYTPNALGRLLGLTPRRSVGLFWRALRRMDRAAARALQAWNGRRYSDHLYVLARKAEEPQKTSESLNRENEAAQASRLRGAGRGARSDMRNQWP